MVRLSPRDNVATALTDLEKGTTVRLNANGLEIVVTVVEDIPFGHKFSLVNLAKGEAVVKYGHCIGLASRDIGVGSHVHVHNLESQRGRGDLNR